MGWYSFPYILLRLCLLVVTYHFPYTIVIGYHSSSYFIHWKFIVHSSIKQQPHTFHFWPHYICLPILFKIPITLNSYNGSHAFWATFNIFENWYAYINYIKDFRMAAIPLMVFKSPIAFYGKHRVLVFYSIKIMETNNIQVQEPEWPIHS